MIPTVIVLAILSGFSTLVFRVIISHRPFRISGGWTQIIISFLLGGALWVLLTVLLNVPLQYHKIAGRDILCGILIFLCAFWCNYWVSNLAGGFRVQMQINLADQKSPVTLDEWMALYDGRGMEVFLADRMKSILISWKIVTLENGKVQLTPGWGSFFGKLLNLLKIILPSMRS